MQVHQQVEESPEGLPAEQREHEFRRQRLEQARSVHQEQRREVAKRRLIVAGISLGILILSIGLFPRQANGIWTKLHGLVWVIGGVQGDATRLAVLQEVARGPYGSRRGVAVSAILHHPTAEVSERVQALREILETHGAEDEILKGLRVAFLQRRGTQRKVLLGLLPHAHEKAQREIYEAFKRASELDLPLFLHFLKHSTAFYVQTDSSAQIIRYNQPAKLLEELNSPEQRYRRRIFVILTRLIHPHDLRWQKVLRHKSPWIRCQALLYFSRAGWMAERNFRKNLAMAGKSTLAQPACSHMLKKYSAMPVSSP